MAYLLEIEAFPIRINERGEWSHGGKSLHPRVELLFRKSIRVNEDGSYRIELGPNKSSIEVSDVAFFVQSISIMRDSDGQVESVQMTLSDGAVESLEPTTLMQSDDNVLYCGVLRDSFLVPCRFPTAAYHELAFLMDFDLEEPTLQIGGVKVSFGVYEKAPKEG